MTATPAAGDAGISGRLAAIPRSRLVVAALVLLSLLALFLLYIKGNDMTFYFDEWDFVLRRHRTTVGIFLEPHNEHFSLVPVIVYKILFATAGLDHYAPYRIVALALHVTIAALVFVFARARVGDVLALAAATLMLFLGAGFEDVLWPFQIGFLFALAAGLGAFILLERETRAGDFFAMILLGVSLASASLGIPVALGAGAYLLVSPVRRGRLWVVLVPLLLYAIWYLGYGKSALRGENVTAAPQYTADEVAGAVGGVVGLAVEWGRILAVVAVAGLALHMARVRKLPRTLVMVLTAAISFWVLTALARAQLQEATISRYVYAGGFFVILLAVEVVRGRRFSGRAIGVVAGVTVLAALSGMNMFKKGADGLRYTDRIVRAEITPLEIGGTQMPPFFVPDPQKAPQIVAGAYLETIRDLGSSPAYSEEQLAALDEGHRQLADGVFVRGYGLALVPGSARPAGPAPAAQPDSAVRIRRSGSCVTAQPAVPGTSETVVLRVPLGGMSLSAPGAGVTLRRYAAGFTGAPALTGDAGAAVLRIPRDRSPRPWYAQVANARSLRACGLG
ncbi:MAG TPA: hypothetical protein VGC98_10280 [Thermoleophilaceae bacterium]